MKQDSIDLDATMQIFSPVKTPTEIQKANDFVLQHPYNRFAGLHLISQSPGKAVTRFPVDGNSVNMADDLHSGLLYGLMDATSFLALITVLRPEELAVTHDLHVSIMRPACKGMEVELHADVVRRGTRLAFLRCEAWRVSGHDTRLIATAKVTKSLSKGRED
jgi:uncharacterized protein (TIGR00369 family)